MAHLIIELNDVGQITYRCSECGSVMPEEYSDKIGALAYCPYCDESIERDYYLNPIYEDRRPGKQDDASRSSTYFEPQTEYNSAIGIADTDLASKLEDIAKAYIREKKHIDIPEEDYRSMVKELENLRKEYNMMLQSKIPFHNIINLDEVEIFRFDCITDAPGVCTYIAKMKVKERNNE